VNIEFARRNCNAAEQSSHLSFLKRMEEIVSTSERACRVFLEAFQRWLIDAGVNAHDFTSLLSVERAPHDFEHLLCLLTDEYQEFITEEPHVHRKQHIDLIHIALRICAVTSKEKNQEHCEANRVFQKLREDRSEQHAVRIAENLLTVCHFLLLLKHRPQLELSGDPVLPIPLSSLPPPPDE
jgi:hypothetical protein